MKLFAKSLIPLSLFTVFTAQATYLEALNAYQTQQYPQAQQEFEHLRELGNANAAFNLGVMAYQGQGEPADAVKALGYFRYAQVLQHSRAGAAVAEVSQGLTPQQLEQANVILGQLQQQQQIIAQDEQMGSEAADAAILPLFRVEPQYPIEAARAGISGFTRMQFIVSPEGEPIFVQVVVSRPSKVFDKESLKAIKKWRYSKSERPQLLSVQLDFKVESKGSDSQIIKKMYKYAEENKLWLGANADYDQHQLALAEWFSLAQGKLAVHLQEDKQLPLAEDLPSQSLFGKVSSATLLTPLGESMPLLVELSAGKVVKAEYGGNKHDLNAKPVGQYVKLGEPLFKQSFADGQYRFWAMADKAEVRLFPVKSLPSNLFEKYWLEQAALNGNLEAQRQLAVDNPQWRQYLTSVGDDNALAWSALEFAAAGDAVQAKQLLQQIKNANAESVSEVVEYTKSLL
ncbi:energy transducer TonB [Shewanella cyperi]|uniref:energy transducer TonB n=1 Tax=Shewanella cyperi TaxID=2814292 RepID=UPI001A95023A|nr:energy transducer TonB [Shewanella cyperi]QSX40339.1 energy transducer TonB [Shewanella cyperi]